MVHTKGITFYGNRRPVKKQIHQSECGRLSCESKISIPIVFAGCSTCARGLDNRTAPSRYGSSSSGGYIYERSLLAADSRDDSHKRCLLTADVDSSLGNDGYSCYLAQYPSTPKRTVEGVMSCDPGPGQTVRFRGEFTETIYPSRSGTVLYNVQDIAQVNGSVVTFNQAIADIYPPTDYVTIYGSRKGNSGAFSIKSVSGNQVTVDTSDLPAGQFIPEAASDPGVLQAAILRPIHFTAWDKSNPPVFSTLYQAYHAINQRVIMVSHLKSIGGNSVNPGYYVWPAFEIDGDNNGNSDFQIFDHLEVINAESAIAIEANQFQSNYDILQYNNIHDVGDAGGSMDELIYWGRWGKPDWHHDYVQIMYNRVGPHNSGALGDGIDTKQSTHNFTIFGNEVFGLNSNDCGDSPIKTEATDGFIANNYVHDIYSPVTEGCGISIVDAEPLDPFSGANRIIVVNNIIANVKGVGISVVDANDIQILNNTVYNILPDPFGDPEHNMGIDVWNWQGSLENIIIKNNIVLSAHIGIGRYIGSHDEFPVSIDSDYNIVFDTDFPFRGTITQNIHDLVMDPGLVDPQSHNFTLMSTSPARDSGTDMTSVFSIDNHDAADPTLPAITEPTIRISPWDRGAYEY
jgi:parallel beta-helix repeat protein